jgi:flagellin
MLALNSHRNLGMVGTQQARASARLSSGFRINSAADDAAGLGISENMRAQIRGLDQASRNAQDAISLVQTAEGGLSTINEMVIRIRELTVQAANDINTTEDGAGLNPGTNESNRARIQGEINHLIDEIQRTATTLQFNSMTLLDGSVGSALSLNDFSGAVTFAGIGAITDATGNLLGTLTNNQMDSINAVISAINNIGAGNLPTAGTAADMLDPADAAFNQAFFDLHNTLNAQGVIGAGDHQMTAAELVTTLGNINTALAGSGGLAGAGGPLWMQVGANAGQGITIEMPNVIDRVANVLRSAFDSPGFGLVNNDNSNTGNVATGDGASITELLRSVDEALGASTAARGALGAIQNRLEFTIQNLDVSSENLQASNSRIRDADMAKEMMRLTQANVLQQAATAMLAQGNQAPQSILQLLG